MTEEGFKRLRAAQLKFQFIGFLGFLMTCAGVGFLTIWVLK
jgi:hypothetical protein